MFVKNGGVKMISQYVKGRVYVFIDAANIFYSCKRLGWKLDYLKLKKYFEENIILGKIYFYTAYDSNYSPQCKFLDFLEMNGYVIKKKKVKFIKNCRDEKGGFYKGNLDVELAIDAVDSKDEFQSFVLFSGDSDFEALLGYMRKHKKSCIVVSTKGHVSVELLRQAKFIDLKKFKKEFDYKKAIK